MRSMITLNAMRDALDLVGLTGVIMLVYAGCLDQSFDVSRGRGANGTM